MTKQEFIDFKKHYGNGIYKITIPNLGKNWTNPCSQITDTNTIEDDFYLSEKWFQCLGSDSKWYSYRKVIKIVFNGVIILDKRDNILLKFI